MTDKTNIGGIMHILGQMAGVVWPCGIPRGIRITLLSEPHRGLRMMLDHQDFRDHQNRSPLMILLGELPRWIAVSNVPLRGITEEHHRRFWDGFHEAPQDDTNAAKRLNVLRNEIPLGGFGRALTTEEIADIRDAGHSVSAGARVIRTAQDTPSVGSVWTSEHEQALRSTDVTVGLHTNAREAKRA